MSDMTAWSREISVNLEMDRVKDTICGVQDMHALEGTSSSSADGLTRSSIMENVKEQIKLKDLDHTNSQRSTRHSCSPSLHSRVR